MISLIYSTRNQKNMLLLSNYFNGFLIPKRDFVYVLPCFIRFHRAMHFSVKRGIAIACRLSVCPSVCNVGEL